MHNPALHNFVPNGPGLYSFSDMHVPPRLYSATREQVKSYVAYDALLRSGEDRSTHPVPLGYDEFVYIFNFNEPNVLVKFTTVEGDNIVKINGPAITIPFLVGEEDEEVQPVAPGPPSVTKPEVPRDLDGGRWLSQRKAALVEDTLWDNLAQSHRQNLRRDEAIQARKDKRSKPYAPRPPPPTHKHPRGPSRRPTNSTPSSDGPSTSATPIPEPGDVRMDGPPGELDVFAADGPLTKKGKGRKT
ncbi:hypothetical protein EDD22DRAFT_850362 [Suillus occidentalis]|nr:hypothetical protein EDD22DRAFT_850362 [Suillus occidentalis]